MVIINDINSAYFLQVFVFGTKPDFLPFGKHFDKLSYAMKFFDNIMSALENFEKRKFKAGEINVILKLRDDPIFMAI